MFRKLFSNTLWSLAAALLSRCSTLIAHGITVLLLGESGYGVVSLVHTTVLVAAAAIGLGFGAAATIIISSSEGFSGRVRSDIATLNRWVAMLSFVAMVILLAARHAVASFCHLDSLQDSHALICGVLLLPFTACGLYQAGVLAGFSSFREQALAGIAGGAITILATLAACPLGPPGVLLAFLMGQLVTCLLQGWRIKCAYRRFGIHETPFDLERNSARRSRIVGLALPAAAMQVTNAPADLITLAALSRGAGGIAEAGVFCATSHWCHLIRFVPFAVAAALLPQLANASAMGRSREALKLALSSIVSVLCISGVLALIVTWNAEGVLSLYGDGFRGRSTLLVLMAGTGVAVAVQYTAEKVLLGASMVTAPLMLAMVRAASYCCLAMATTDLDAERLGVYRCVTFSGHALIAASMAIFVVARRCREGVAGDTLEGGHQSMAA